MTFKHSYRVQMLEHLTNDCVQLFTIDYLLNLSESIQRVREVGKAMNLQDSFDDSLLLVVSSYLYH